MRTRITLAILPALLFQGCTSLRSDPQSQVTRLAGTAWRAETIGGVAVSPQIESTLEVDAEQHVAGLGGCNPYVSDIGVESGAVQFAKVMSANVICPPEQVDQERRFFEALAAARKIQTTRDQLVLLDETGSTVLQLKRATLLMRKP